MYNKFLLIMSLSSVMAVAQAKKESFNYPPHKLTDNGWVDSNIGKIFEQAKEVLLLVSYQ